ncbi:glycosyltransferase family 1 protein [Ramaria rubella]|nr:glycosyltransferase family 1 protein [Ramaria rubella]
MQSKEDPIPAFLFVPATVITMLRSFGSETSGGLRDVQPLLMESLKGVENQEKLKKLTYEPDSLCLIRHGGLLEDIVHLPGLQPLYDYELIPQQNLVPDVYLGAMAAIMGSLSLSAGVLLNTSDAYEPAATSSYRSFLNSVGYGQANAGEAFIETGDSRKLVQFLDSAMQKHGECSVIYISFGSVYWPSESQYVAAWIEILLEFKVPFITVADSQIPDPLATQIKESDNAIMIPWAPRPAVLAHAATRWFLSRCGHSSCTEAMAAGVPIIAWPCEGDQPLSASHLTLTLDVAFQLVQVQSDVAGLGPLYRGNANATGESQHSDSRAAFIQPQGTLEAVQAEARDILHRIKGEEGVRKRKNAQALQDRFRGLWEAAGEARKGTEDFLSQFTARTAN